MEASESFEEEIMEALNVMDCERFSSDAMSSKDSSASLDNPHYQDLNSKPKIKLFIPNDVDENHNSPCIICKMKQWFCC